jgi:hypothetical protein
VLQRDWLKTRRQLLNEVKRQVRLRVGPEPSDISAYIRRYDAEFSRPWMRSSQAELMKAVMNAQIVLGADFHAFNQSQRIHLRILRSLPRHFPMILALEALSSKHQSEIDQFVAGDLAEGDFLERIRWDKNWGFPWVNYKPLLELARERGIRVIGINRGAGRGHGRVLVEREKHSAKIISQQRLQNPEKAIYVVIGDLHLARGHLPQLLLQERPSSSTADRVITILQNSEHLYFKLARRGREHDVDVMRAKGDRFCVLGSPPWVKWQNYLMYLEQTYDRDLGGEETDLTDHVASFAMFIARDLGLSPDLERMAVTTVGDKEAWQQKVKSLNLRTRRLIKHLFAREKSFYLPQIDGLFLTRLSINHAAYLAGAYLHARACDLQRAPWNFPGDFPAHIWCEAMGFFTSKLINHKRQADSGPRLRAEWRRRGLTVERSRVLKLCLKKSSSGRDEHFLEAGSILGGILGEQIYRALTHGILPLEDIRQAMSVDPLGKEFVRFFEQFQRDLNRRLRRGM